MSNDLKKTNMLLDELSDMIESAQNALLFSKMIKIDGERAKEIIKEIHLSLPKGMQVADIVLEDREKIEANAIKRADEIIKEANAKANELLMRAKTEAERMISQDYITNEARKSAKEIVDGAKAISDDIKRGVMEYFHLVFDKLEAEVKSTEDQIALINEKLATQRDVLDINRAKIDEFTDEYDENIEIAQSKLIGVVSEHLSKLAQKE